MKLPIYKPALNGTAFMGMAKRNPDGSFGPELAVAVAFWTPHMEAQREIELLRTLLNNAFEQAPECHGSKDCACAFCEAADYLMRHEPQPGEQT
jgi:hypothetical protein